MYVEHLRLSGDHNEHTFPHNADCSLRDLSPSLVEENRVCGSVSGGGVCYSGDSVGSVAVYFCDDGYTLEGDTTRECLSSGLWNGSTPQCVEIPSELLISEYW